MTNAARPPTVRTCHTVTLSVHGSENPTCCSCSAKVLSHTQAPVKQEHGHSSQPPQQKRAAQPDSPKVANPRLDHRA